MDYVWGAVDKNANCCARTTKAQLIDRIKAVFETLLRESVTSACARFWDRTEAVIDTNGGYFELNLLAVVQFPSLFNSFSIY